MVNDTATTDNQQQYYSSITLSDKIHQNQTKNVPCFYKTHQTSVALYCWHKNTPLALCACAGNHIR